MAGISFKVEGLDELVDSIDRLGNLPRKHVRAAARKASQKVLTATRKIAPRKTRALKKGITKKEEKSRTPGKAVFDIRMDSKKNDVFVKEYNGKRAYYPASQEYGFKTRSGRKVQGKYYFKRAAEQSKGQFEREVIQELSKRIDAEWAKG